MNAHGIIKKVGISVLAQLISLVISFVMNMIVPKYISELSYSYWQTYLLYVNYVGVLHFGLLDGIMLRYSQFDYDQLDKPLVRSQYRFLFLVNVIFTVLFAIYALSISREVTTAIIILVGIGIVTKNSFNYTSYTFQMTNRISGYAILTILQRVTYGVASVFLIVGHCDLFVMFCVADLMGDTVGIIYGFIHNKELYFGKAVSLKSALEELKTNISAGIKLMIATWSSIMLVGLARIIVQVHWNELIFGKVSFAFSLSNLFLTFVTAASIVLFPSLKRMNKEELPKLYIGLREIVTPFLFVIMIFYFPGCWILRMWLPKYSSSLIYLSVLLPMIVFLSKTSLLTDNYLKSYRKEKQMLYINIISLIVAVVGFAVSAWVLNSVEALLLWVAVTIMIKSIISEIVVTHIIGINVLKEFVYEIVMFIVFVIIAQNSSLLAGMLIYSLVCLIYLIVHRKNLKYIKSIIRRKECR